MMLDGFRVVKRERDAVAVYDADAKELFWDGPWPLSKSKWLRENGTGHRCYYIGWPAPAGLQTSEAERVTAHGGDNAIDS